MAAHQAPPSLGFSRQEHWSGLPFPSPIIIGLGLQFSSVAQSCPTLCDPMNYSTSLSISNSWSLLKFMSIKLVTPSNHLILLSSSSLPAFNLSQHQGLFQWVSPLHQMANRHMKRCSTSIIIHSVQSLSHVWLFATPWTAARQASLSITNSQSLLKLMSIDSVMPFNYLILCHSLFLLPQSFPASGSFPISWFFTTGGQSIGATAWASVLPMNIRGWFILGLIY